MVPVLRALPVLGATLIVAACAAPAEQRPVVTSTTYVTASPPAMSETAPEPATTAGNELDAVARSVVSVFGGSVGIAVAGADGVISGGDDGAYPAWSTIKVPIAVAATRVAPDQAQLYAPAAIHNSDNVAAESLWALVTPGDVNQVLADAGVDASVNTLPIRTEFSTFGQTALSASQEATLAGHLACVAGAKDVLELMGNVSPDQAYGLGQLPGARLKGGWGPSPSGGYQVRQVARVTNTRGNDVALALTVIPATGEYASAQAMADAVAAELRPLLDALPTAAC